MFEQYDIVLRDRVLYTYNILETDIWLLLSCNYHGNVILYNTLLSMLPQVFKVQLLYIIALLWLRFLQSIL